MIIEPKEYTYETMPEYEDEVEGALEIEMTGNEVGLTYIPDVVYAKKPEGTLHLQIIVPSVFNDPERVFPCVVFAQGSAWMKQDVYRNVPYLSRLAERGYVVAIQEYRHSGIAKFPAPIEDAKDAIRFMKKNCETYHVDPEKVVMMGDSSGGHVCMMTGLTAGSDLFDGSPEEKDLCRVKGMIDLYGAVDPTLPYGFPTTLNHQLPDSPEGMELGYNIRENNEKAQIAAAKNYASMAEVPVLILHGSKDKTVFCEESVQLYHALKEAGKDAAFCFVRHSDHGGAGFWKKEAIDLYDSFIQRCLKG